MKKAIGKILLSVLLYFLVMLFINFIFSIVLSLELHLNVITLTIDLLGGFNIEQYKNSEILSIIVILKQAVQTVLLTVLSGYIISVFINREAKIIFPDKIILRRRTSEGSNGLLTFSALIGVPGKRWLYDVKCTMNCTYYKNDIQRNSECYSTRHIEFIQNYFRFSFSVYDFPKIFWQQFLERGEHYSCSDFITLTLVGKSDGFGGQLRKTKKYFFNDIVVDVSNPENRFIRKFINPITGKERRIINWKIFPHSMESGVSDREDILNEIKKYVYSDD